MATNHNVNVNLNNGMGSGGGHKSPLKTSAKRSIMHQKEMNTAKFKIGKMVAKSPQALNPNAYGAGALKRLGIAGAVAYAGVQMANKAMDIYFDIRQASTGDQLMIGNVRRVRNYVMNPAKYFIDDIYNYGFLEQKRVNRQNEQNQYYRELTGKAIVGNQYGQKR